MWEIIDDVALVGLLGIFLFAMVKWHWWAFQQDPKSDIQTLFDQDKDKLTDSN